MRSALVGPSSPEWAQALDRVDHDFYHLPGYASLDAWWMGGKPRAVVVEAEGATLLAPFVLRPCPEAAADLQGRFDAVSPYGYGGVIIGPSPVDEGTTDALLRAMMDVLAAEGVVAAFMRLHPILDACSAALERVGTVVRHDDTIGIDLARAPEEWEAALTHNHRRGLKKLRASGYVAYCDEWDYYPAFIEMYADTMRRLSADPFYQFSPEYMEGLTAAVGPGAHFCMVVSPEGAPAAGGIFVRTGGIVQYHLSASDEVFRNVAPTKLAIAHVVRCAHEQGCRCLHLGGGGASLRRFKEEFGNITFPLRSARLVPMPDAYEAACRAVLGDDWTRCDAGYFPEYRASPPPG